MNQLKVLVACEYSGIVRDAFEDTGCNAWSCDILPTESDQTKEAGKHIQADIMRVLNKSKSECNDWHDLKNKIPFEWDLLIGHPPCTFLSFVYTGKERYSPERLQNKIYAYQFFLDLWNAPVAHICLENPMGYAHSGLLPYTQIIEPYYFGHNYKKKTCLWLKNLPKLTYSLTDTLFEKKTAAEPKFNMLNGSRKDKTKLPQLLKPFDDKKLKSKFHSGIARAMAQQWTEYINQLKIKN